ncbi:phage-encoded membrane protein [Burkholderia cenocepacia]|uniref:Alpha/beta hydrolase n=1 Tax=Burkholderia phage AP3 TaxID=1636201 RepID=A0A1S5NPT4_9CAUD|nr:alpha/beta hydrolase [Burkholderia cenocepacia]YP_009785129.1 membrane protein [Burkholderia phage AP3]AKA61159.1 alpha/beta hydrolase [Burkholderia phage AP3]CAB5080383.1 phage-encoded membrane protein [Burkholderia cenocepacia]CAB5090769.1 phage-encoded membrane protein [Burkholderia cenocepacia]CAB5094412.1 phage-encoded membrane protein [Burkholderia cenocepacia]CAB5096750.1 phage-encoded membrane protein [Burkholderia cenocepacia]
MNQKFSGDVGQVAGGDVKSNNAQANVNFHFHSEKPAPVATKFISDRQRNAIARKAFEIEEKTGTDKLMVYRRLMTVFDFERMDEMPRNVYERAIKYLDGWIRNGTLAQTPTVPAQQEAKEPEPAALQPVAPSDLPAENPAPAAVAAPAPVPSSFFSPGPGPASAYPQSKRSPWLAVVVAVTASGAIAAALYAAMHRNDAPAQALETEPPRHCEYGGERYSPGSVVMQAGVRRQCVAVEGGAAWQKADPARR